MRLNYVTSEGKIVIPSTAIVPALIDNHLKMSAIQFENGPFMQMGSGDVTLDYQLPTLAGANYQTMEMTGTLIRMLRQSYGIRRPNHGKNSP